MSTPRRLWLGAAAAAFLVSLSVAVPAQAAAQQPELLVQDVVGAEPVTPGDVIAYQPIVHNGGSATAEVLYLELFDDEYAHHTQQFSNCRYLDDSRHATCEFTISLAPGETAQVPADGAVELQVLPNAPHGWRINANYRVSSFDEPVLDPDGELGDGPELPLEKLPDAEFDGGDDDFANVLFDVGPNPADLEAVGTEIAGAVGDLVTMEVGVENHGPADIGPLSPGEGSTEAVNQVAVTVTVPEGVTVVEVLRTGAPIEHVGSCVPVVDGEPAWERAGEPGATSYRCGAIETALVPGDVWLFPFQVEITGSAGATGTVEVAEAANDPDPGNNTAEITLAVGPAGSGGGSDDGLPVTGVPISMVAGAGAVALAAGVGLYLLARRRRIPTS